MSIDTRTARMQQKAERRAYLDKRELRNAHRRAARLAVRNAEREQSGLPLKAAPVPSVVLLRLRTTKRAAAIASGKPFQPQPNPTIGFVAADPSQPMGDPPSGRNLRKTVFGGSWDGTQLQRAQAIRGSCLAVRS